MNTTASDPLIGQSLDGRYRIDARIAVGGMATVYQAVDTRLDRVLALKVMHPSLAADDAFVERFIREAKSAALLAHPNVVGVFDQGTDGGYVYLAMEYVAGCTLRDVLRERGALQPRAALDVLEPVLAALGAAHRAGLVHRDMKPENVLIGDDGRVKVADFGLVRAVDAHTQSTGSLLGTVAYLAPEQIEQGTTDARVDIYACGTMLYEMLTGGKPHPGGTAAQVLYQHLHRDVPAPSAAVPGLAPALDTLVVRATARDPQERPDDAVRLLAEVRATRGALSVEQLDAIPPQVSRAPDHEGGGRTHPAGPVSAEDPTQAIPRWTPAGPGSPTVASGHAAQADDAPHHTSRLETPATRSGPPDGQGARRGLGGLRERRPLAALIAIALLVLGLGVGIWYVTSGQFTQTPGVLAKSEAEAKKIVDEAGLRVRIDHAYSDRVQRGRVIESDPAPGARIRDTGTVTLTVSRGPRIVRIPELAGSPLETARSQLRGRGLTPGEVTREFDSEVAQGSVIRTDPAAGERRRPRTAVDLVVSRGVAIRVPDVIGQRQDSGQQRLRASGFAVTIAEKRVFDALEAGRIVKQSVSPGSRAAAGQEITLTLSRGPDMVQVPNVRGMKESKARDVLEAADFKVRIRRFFFFGTVWAQSTEGGDEAPRGSTITIWVR